MESKENKDLNEKLQGVITQELARARKSPGRKTTARSRPRPTPPGNISGNCQVFYIGNLSGPTSFTFHPGSPPQVAPPAPAAPARPWHFVVACLGVAALAASLLMHLH